MSRSATRRPCAWAVIARRELLSFFTGPVAYTVCAVFLLFAGILFFSTFFLVGRAELRNFFATLPPLFSLFIPAVTMRSFSEETKTGSFETLVTLPVSTWGIVGGKYLALLASCAALLVPTLLYVVICAAFGSPDAGPIVGGYLGAVLLAAAFAAIGMFCSSVTRNQIMAFFLALLVCMALTYIGQLAIFMPASFAQFLSYISAQSHFESVSRGVLDSRDMVYFASLAALFFAMTVRSVESARRG